MKAFCGVECLTIAKYAQYMTEKELRKFLSFFYSSPKVILVEFQAKKIQKMLFRFSRPLQAKVFFMRSVCLRPFTFHEHSA